MKLLELTLEEYDKIYTEHQHVFGTTAFAKLNAEKAKKVIALSLVNDKGKHIIGVILGEHNDGYACPFSAPFGEICCLKPQRLDTITEFVDLLRTWLNGRPLRLTLAPKFYNPSMHEKLCGILANKSTRSFYDFNYHYPTRHFEHFIDYLERNARKNFKRAMTSGFTFEKTDDLSRAYAVIKQNRSEHGYPLRMTEQQVRDTVSTVVKADYFVLTYADTDVAAAIVYHVAPGIVQVIYWGNINGYNELRPMNILPYKVFEYYHQQGIEIIDIGPSSSDGIPSIGLCNFKESIGCIATLKPTYYL